MHGIRCHHWMLRVRCSMFDVPKVHWEGWGEGLFPSNCRVLLKSLSMNRPLPGGEQASVRAAKVPLLGGVRGGFMVPMHDHKTKEALHDPLPTSPSWGEGIARGPGGGIKGLRNSAVGKSRVPCLNRGVQRYTLYKSAPG